MDVVIHFVSVDGHGYQQIVSHFSTKMKRNRRSILILTLIGHVFDDNRPIDEYGGRRGGGEGWFSGEIERSGLRRWRATMRVYEGVEAVLGRWAAKYNNPRVSMGGIGVSMMWETARSWRGGGGGVIAVSDEDLRRRPWWTRFFVSGLITYCES